MAKLLMVTDNDVRWIRNVGVKQKISYSSMARMFGVSKAYIYDIIHYKRKKKVLDIN